MPYHTATIRFWRVPLLTGLVASVIGAAAHGAKSTAIPEAPTRLLATGLQLPDRFATSFGWLDANALAVTTLPPGIEGPYADQRRLVAVDSRTGRQVLLLERGFLDCTNPHSGLVAAHVGDLRQLLDSKAPPPVQTWFRWDAAQTRLLSSQLAAGQQMHTVQCRPFNPEDDRNGQVMMGAAPVRVLEAGHGQIRWTYDPMTQSRTDVHWEKGSERRTLNVPAEHIAAFVGWLPYRSAYMLSPGIYEVAQGRMTEKLPLTTLDLRGHISRQPPPLALAPLLSNAWTHQVFTLPMRDGELIAVHGRSHDGAGLYRRTKQGLQRLFCGPPPGLPLDESLQSQEYCFQDAPITVSPDGCKAAFVTRYDAEGNFRSISMQGEIHVLDLCGKAVR